MDLKSLKYNKIKCVLEFRPVNALGNPTKFKFPIDILYYTVPDYSYYTEKDKTGTEFFIPCYKAIGLFEEDIYMHESTRPGQIEIPGKDDRKKIPMRLYGKFLQVSAYYPIFCGYFNNTFNANREFNQNFKPWLEKTIIVTERIHNFPELYDKFDHIAFEKPKKSGRR